MFKKDILIVDFEATGFDVEKDDPVQIGLVLLDKNTIQEKLSYSSWIYTDKELSENLKGFKWANIKEEKFGKRMVYLASTHKAKKRKTKGTDADDLDRDLLFL